MSDTTEGESMTTAARVTDVELLKGIEYRLREFLQFSEPKTASYRCNIEEAKNLVDELLYTAQLNAELPPMQCPHVFAVIGTHESWRGTGYMCVKCGEALGDLDWDKYTGAAIVALKIPAKVQP
jgi:hypothetical protein